MLCSEGASGPELLLQLGRLIVRARSDAPAEHKHTQHTHHTQQTHTQQPASEEDARLEATLSSHIDALWTQQAPFCVEVVLAPSCPDCCAAMSRDDSSLRGLLLERWTMRALLDKSESPSVISSPWLLNAVRSQLHFSQLSAWRARRAPRHERRRKLSREQCTIKKLESNVEAQPERRLSVVYSVRSAPERAREFARPPAGHTFPLTDTGNNTYLKVVLESLPRLEEIPEVVCGCKRRGSKERLADELGARLNDLTIGSRKYEGAINSNIGPAGRRNSLISNPNPSEYNLVDDRMHTPCSESGKHKCNCDEDSDPKTPPGKLDERRIKQIAKYKRRIRKEMTKFCDSTSSEGEKRETTSIPILQASRFDRFRAIGCYRNQTYLTLPASRIETKSPFIDNDYTPPEFKKTNTIATQTEFACSCGNPLEVSHKCDSCRGMVRSEGTYNLASLGARRKLDDDGDKSLKKHKCDNNISNFNEGIIKRPKLRRLYPILDRLERIVSDRSRTENDMQELHLKTDDSVFCTPTEGNSPRKELHTRNYDSNDESDLGHESGKFKPKYNQELNHNMDETGKLDPKSNQELNPNMDESGKLNPKCNQELDSNLSESEKLHRKCNQKLHLNMDESGKVNPKCNQELHPNNDESGIWHPKYNQELHPNNDESGKLHLKYNQELHPNNDESGKWHPKCNQERDESGKRHPKYNHELHLNNDESGKLHTKYNDVSNHAETNGYSSKRDTNDTPTEVSRNPYNEETPKVSKRQKTFSINDDEFITYEKCDYGTIDKHDSEIESPVEELPDFKFSNPERNEIEGDENIESLKEEFQFPSPRDSVPSPREAALFRARVHSSTRLVGQPPPPRPAPRRRPLACFGYDETIRGVQGLKSALFQPLSPLPPHPAPRAPSPRREPPRIRHRPNTGLLGSFEESALQGRLEAVATVHGFTAELAASGAFCPPHRRLPVTVFFYAPGGTAAPYMGHINLGPGGYMVPRAGSVQVSLFNPHGTLVKMFRVLYDLSAMPRAATTFLRQRTLRVSAAPAPALRYLIHLRFMTTKTGKLYLHTDIRLIVSRKADLDTATALRAPPATPRGAQGAEDSPPGAQGAEDSAQGAQGSASDAGLPDIGCDSGYELKSFTFAPDNPKYSPR